MVNSGSRRPRATTRATRAKKPASPRQVTNTRVGWVIAILILVAVILIGRLAWIQVVWGPELRQEAAGQRTSIYIDPARRGEVVDREGNQLAYTMKARSLTVSPNTLRDEVKDLVALQMRTEGVSEDNIRASQDARAEDYLRKMANSIPVIIGNDYVIEEPGEDTTPMEALDRALAEIEEHGGSSAKVTDAKDSEERKIGAVSSKDIHDKLHADSNYEVLVRNVDPDVAMGLSRIFHGLAADHQDIRKYPNGAIGENIIGKVSMDGQGQFGLEASSDAVLTGINGRSVEDVSGRGMPIPGTLRDVVPTVDGAQVELTIDLDLQTYVQQTLEQAKANSEAKGAEAVVLDARTAEVLAMANTGTIDPNGNLEKQLAEGRDFENNAISHPFEPGSVAKIITAAASLEEGTTTPEEVHQVPGSIDMAGVTVADAWEHGVVPYTTAGIFGKSSNVGTLQLAQRLGEERYWDYLQRFGLGKTTGIELPNESAGILPVLEQWSGGTFANLPIGQGMSWSALQMASVFQTLANDGKRIEPRIISKVTGPDGAEIAQPEPATNKVVSPETARTTVDMFRAVFQEDPNGVQNGTAQGNTIEGYQLSGKTGTAQKVDEETGAYSNSRYWITFAGIAPADDPRFVVAIMLDEPQRGPLEGGAGGQSAAPVFKQIAAWLLNRENIPPSPEAKPYVLQAQ